MSRSFLIFPLLALVACGGLDAVSPSDPATDPDGTTGSTSTAPSGDLGTVPQASASETTESTAVVGSQQSEMSSSRFRLVGALRARND